MPTPVPRRAPTRARNRHPRPSLAVSPPAPIYIARADAQNSGNISVRLFLSGPVTVNFAIETGFEDFTEAAGSAFINPIMNEPTIIEVVFINVRNRVGDSVGWSSIPASLAAIGISVMPNSAVIVQARP